MRVVIAEDLALLRDGLTRLLRDNGFDVIAAVEDGDALLRVIATEKPDIAIVDIRLPPTFRDEGVRAAVEARRRVPETAILVVSQYVEQTYAAELLADGNGGVGYLLKDRVMDVADFVDAVRRVATGGTALDPEVVSQLFSRRRVDGPLRAADPARARGARPDGRGALQRGDRRAARAHRRRGREAHRQHPPEAAPCRPRSRDHRRVLAVLAYLQDPES